MNSPQKILSTTVEVADGRLNVHCLGATNKPPLVMVHGMQDVSDSLLPIAETLAQDHRVLIPDLRGHGKSSKTQHYHINSFVFDLYNVVTTLCTQPAIVFGHSLGGHIGSRFTATFPELTRGYIVVEGLGPPQRAYAGNVHQELMAFRAQLLRTMGPQPERRPLPSLEFAIDRLVQNNPRMPVELAVTVANAGTELNQQGQLVWSFDPKVASVFTGMNEEYSERFWQGVQCPTLIVTGSRSHEYWIRSMANVDLGEQTNQWNGKFKLGELEARLQNFADYEHQEIDNAGHMVHYDAPATLATVTQEFIRRRL